MAVIGFNDSVIQNVYKAIGTSRSAVGEKIGGIIQNKVLNPMGDAWWAPEAVKYWKGTDGKGFQPAVKKCETKIKKAYEQFADQVRVSVEHWQKNTGKADKVSAAKFDAPLQIKLNYDVIKKDNNGVVGIDDQKATTVEQSLPNVKNDIKAELGKLASKLEGVETLFLGKNQAQDVQTCFKQVNEALSELFAFFSDDGDGKSLKTIIKEYVDKYGSVAQSVSKSFSMDEGSSGSGTTVRTMN